jgi:hypothetical protein
MTLLKEKKEKVFTGAIILVSLLGILYFGILEIWENRKKIHKNPYKYNLNAYENSQKNLVHYTELEPITLNGSQLYGLLISPDDKIYISVDQAILIFDRMRRELSKLETQEPVYCMDISGNQDLYLGMKNHIEIINKQGKTQAQWQPLAGQAFITSLVLSSKNVYIADAGNRIIWEFTLKGEFVKKIGGKDKARDIPGFIIPSYYFDIDLDSDGSLWVVNPGRHCLENYTIDGALRTSWGQYSTQLEGFCGCCNPTHFKLLANGSFVTSEKGIARVKVYNAMGALESMVAGPDQFLKGTKGLDLAIDSLKQIYVLDAYKKQVRIFKKKQ